MGRQENIEIFEDTRRRYEHDTDLMDSVARSLKQQELILEDDRISKVHGTGRPTRIVVSRKRTLEAARAYHGKQVCVLNFASATHPGGGVLRGSSAQEEALCRCSTLYPNLSAPEMQNGFYTPHRRARNPLHSDDCIYTPGVTVFKSDTAYPHMLPETERYTVNVLSCAAPNLRRCTPQPVVWQLLALYEQRLTRVFDLAAARGNEVLVLGAFGCGAFGNPPEVVAEAMRSMVLMRQGVFACIEFAVYCPPHDDSNYRAFAERLGGL